MGHARDTEQAHIAQLCADCTGLLAALTCRGDIQTTGSIHTRFISLVLTGSAPAGGRPEMRGYSPPSCPWRTTPAAG